MVAGASEKSKPPSSPVMPKQVQMTIVVDSQQPKLVSVHGASALHCSSDPTGILPLEAPVTAGGCIGTCGCTMAKTTAVL